MAGRRAPESEEYVERAAAERAIRILVANQARDLIASGDRLGSRGEFSTRLGLIVRAENQIAEAMGRNAQAREMGLPLTPSVTDEIEARELLRQAVMECAAAAAGWVVAMDFENRATVLRAAAVNGGGSDGSE